MRQLYNLLLYLLAPFLCLRFAWQGLAGREDWRRIPERFGHGPQCEPVAVWVHAVSVGEVMAAQPLIQELVARHGRAVLVTTSTATGSDRVRESFGDAIQHCYLPLDLPHVVRRFVTRMQPRRVIIMETELWPNLFRTLRGLGVPVVIANGRISPNSFARYRRVGEALAGVLNDCFLIAAQSEADASRFVELGAETSRVVVMGNLKFDFHLPEEQVASGRRLRKRIGLDVPVWVGASTREGEERAVLKAHRALRVAHPTAVLILVPRHPQRFDGVAQSIADAGFDCIRRSSLGEWTDDASPLATAVLLGDSMGELPAYYAAADIAFVGGSLAPIGGHNVLEPAALSMPVVFGPHMFNFAAARDLLIGCGGAVQVEAENLGSVLSNLLGDEERRIQMGQAARESFEANRGALKRFIKLYDSMPA